MMCGMLSSPFMHGVRTWVLNMGFNLRCAAASANAALSTRHPDTVSTAARIRTTFRRCAIMMALTISSVVGMAQSGPELAARVAGSNVTMSFDLHPQRTDRAILDGGTAPKIETAVLAECALVP